MSNLQAKTLQIFLPTGEPRGIRIAEVTTRIVQAVLIPRSELAEAKKRRMIGLKGHRSVGGIRVSVYNSCPMEAAEAVTSFMKEFAKSN